MESQNQDKSDVQFPNAMHSVLMVRSIYVAILTILVFSLELQAQGVKIDTLTSGSVTSIITDGEMIFAGAAFTGNWRQGGGVYSSSDNGVTWGPVHFFDTAPMSLAKYGTTLLVGTYGTGIYISSNNGVDWNATNLTSSEINAFASIDTNIFAASYTGYVYRSTDKGAYWTSVSTQTPYSISSLCTSGRNLYAGSYPGGGVFLSTNNGDLWSHLGTDFPFATISDLAILDSNIFASTQPIYRWPGDIPQSFGVFRLSADDTTWSAVNAGLQSLQISCLIASGKNLFAGSWLGHNISAGVFISTNAGLNWSLANGNFGGPSNITAMAANGEYLFWGVERFPGPTYSIWRQSLNELITSVTLETVIAPTHLEHFCNYPNPFNPSTTIGYDLSVPQHIALRVYNMLGEEVATLVDRNEEPGFKSVKFDASNLASGVYYYRLQAGTYSVTKKFLLLK